MTQTIHQLFEKQVLKTPNGIALIYNDIKLTYNELNQRANALAHYLRGKYRLQGDDIVALCLDRSEQVIIAMLAVLKSGAAYVPIDPNYPDARIAYMLTDTSAKVLITNSNHEQRFEKLPLWVIDKKSNKDLLSNERNTNPPITITAKNLVYVIYTSGTTGKPKGVLIEHRALVNYTKAILEKIKIPSNATMSALASVAADLGYTALFSALCSGRTLYLFPENAIYNPEILADHMKKTKIDCLKITPSHLTALMESAHPAVYLPQLCLILGGEVVRASLIKQIKKYASPHLVIINHYGPTETTVGALTYQYNDSKTLNQSLPIGRPLKNIEIYILNKQHHCVPIGLPGQLYIGGAGIARGYLNQPKLTAEKFIDNPFIKHSKIYQTGDRVRMLPDGNIDFIGRVDFQIKIRGFRVELGEIEAVLLNYPGIKQVVVVARGEESKYIVGYYVCSEKIDEELVYHYLAKNLPNYMFPTALLRLKQFPLTQNGKIDRNALPEIKLTNEKDYVPARNEIESQVINILANILNIKRQAIGINDDFFRLGGDSIKSIQFVNQLSRYLNIRMSIKDIFNSKTIANLIENVIASQLKDKKVGGIAHEEGVLKDEVKLLPIQQRFFNNVKSGRFKNPNYWNQAFLLKVKKMDLDLLKKSIKKLIEYHDALRINYKKTKGGLKQYYNENQHPPKLKILHLSNLSNKEALDAVLTRWQSQFKLMENKPLFCFGYISTDKDNDHRIFIAAHHLIIDTVSWRILAHDLDEIYNALKQKKEPQLGPKGTSYRQWVEVVDQYSHTHKMEKRYWQPIIDKTEEYNHHLTSLIDSFYIRNIVLDKKNTKKLLTACHAAYHTDINDLLLTAFNLALHDILDTKVNYITLEGHGREALRDDIDINHTVGWFTTMFPIKLTIHEELAQTLIATKEYLRGIPNKGLGFGAHYGYNKIPLIVFNYLGQFENIALEHVGKEISKKNKDVFVLFADGYVVKDRLHFKLRGQFNLDLFAKQFLKHIKSVIHYTSNLKRSYLTPSDTGNIISKDDLDQIQSKQEISHVFLANGLQEGYIYYEVNKGMGETTFRGQWIYHYEHSIKKNLYKKAWEHVLIKFPGLRLRFSWQQGMVQIVDKNQKLKWEYQDISKLPKILRAQTIRKTLAEDRQKDYQLDKGQLLRICLIKQAESEYTCIISMHYILVDGWSMPVLFEYLHQTYLDLEKSIKIIHETDTAYIKSQEYLQKYSDSNYWISRINKIDEHQDLSGLLRAKSRSIKLNTYRDIKNKKKYKFHIANEFYQRIKSLSIKEHITVNAIMQYAWHKVLMIYGNSATTVVGTTVSGRYLPVRKIESSVGLYDNVLPLIIKHDNRNTVIQGIREIQTALNVINTKSNVSWLKTHDSFLFDNFFIFINYPPSREKFSELRLVFEEEVEEIDYPLGLTLTEFEQGIEVSIGYAGELFPEESLIKLQKTMSLILEQVIHDPTKPQINLKYLAESDYQKIVYEWNNTNKNYPADKLIHQLFEAQALKTPNHIAVIYDNIQLTYKALNEKANQLAHYLIKNYQIVGDDFIPLCLDRSEKMLIAILGVLKAGAAYVPIAPDYPDERIAYILDDTKAKVIIVNQAYSKRFDKTKLIIIDQDTCENTLANESNLNPNVNITPEHLSYVIYTSGTTGKPKGIMIPHRGVVNRITWMNEQYPLSTDDRVLQKTPYVFDVSVWELLWANWYGAVIVFLKPNGHKDPEEIIKTINQHKITVIHFVPTMLSVFTDQLSLDMSLTSNIRYLFCSGESLSLTAVKSFNQLYPNVKIVNLYGPTEASIDVLYYDCSENNYQSVYLGKPIANTKAYILNKDRHVLPIGANGELYIAGVGLARGYLNNDKLTAEKFIESPFVKHGRMYATGDLVRFLDEGTIDYIGRADSQVKIRGFRIELGEIEAVLAHYPGIIQAAVCALGEQNKYLAAYYVSNKTLDHQDINSYLKKVLPEYMIPAFILKLEKLPLTINGKLDRKSLPIPELTQQISYIPPHTEIEKQMLEIWAELLNTKADKISVKDDFYRLGGDSIKSIQVASQIRHRMNLIVRTADIFNYKTIEGIIENVINNQLNKLVNVVEIHEVGVLSGEIKLLPIQKWFFNNVKSKLIKNPNYWNQAFLIQAQEIDLSVLNESIKILVEYHDALRINFKLTKSKIKQYYNEAQNIPKTNVLDVKNINNQDETNKALTRWQNHFELFSDKPLYCFGLIKLNNGKGCQIFIAAHHLIIDTVSWRILAHDLLAIYNTLKENKELKLPQKGTSYRQWVDYVYEYEKQHANEKKYWHSVVDKLDKYNALINALITKHDMKKISLNTKATKNILTICHKAFNTDVNDLLLSAFNIALADTFKQPINYVTLEGHGREAQTKEIDLNHTVGWFTTMFPIELEKYDDIRNTIIATKEYLRKIPNKGLGFGPLFEYSLLPGIVFNYLGQFNSIALEQAGVTVSPKNDGLFVLTVDGYVIDDQMHFQLNAKFFLEEFHVNFKKQLLQVINYTEKLDRTYLTASDISNVLSQKQLDVIQKDKEISHVFLANGLKTGFMYFDLHENARESTFHGQWILHYTHSLKIDLYKRAWEYVIEKFPGLRLRFSWNQTPIQIIDKQGCLDWRFHDYSKLAQNEQQSQINKIITNDRNEDYQLDKGKLLRVYLIKKSTQDYTCVLGIHYIMIDGWSIPILFNTVHQAYLDIEKMINLPVNEDSAYIKAQEYLQKYDDSTFWHKILSSVSEHTNLVNLIQPEKHSIQLNLYRNILQKKIISLEISNELYVEIKNFCLQCEITINALLQFVWHQLLRFYGGSKTTITATTVSGRNIPIDNIENSVGLYVNTLPLVVNHDLTNVVLNGLNAIHASINDISNHCNISWLKLHKSKRRLYNNLFVYGNYPVSVAAFSELGLTVQGEIEEIDYPLAIFASENNVNQIDIQLIYAGEVFIENVMQDFSKSLILIIKQVIENPSQQLLDLKFKVN